MKYSLYAFLLIAFMGFSSCKKDKEILIDGNTAPPDGTISNVVKENYVNKAYISILGRKPVASELSAGLTILNQHNLSLTDRHQFLDDVIAKPGYNQRLYDIAVADLLNNLDTAAISQMIYVFGILLTDPQYQPQWPLIQAEKTKLEQLKNAVPDLEAGTLDVIGLHKRCVNNYFYDQLNMGSENFVVSMFQHFLLRYPTLTELDEGKKMVDGFSAVLFLQTGSTKNDFIQIFCNSSNYFEGQVRDLYLRYLFREPNSTESAEEAADYKSTLDYKQLQKNILSTDEYAGI